jgi:hypothetical protein
MGAVWVGPLLTLGVSDGGGTCLQLLHCGLGKKPDGILASRGKNSGNKIFRGGRTESLFQSQKDLPDTTNAK